MESADTEAKRLRDDVEWALRSALDASEVLPLLHRLARMAASGSEEWTYAHRNLAELLVERNPWRAALHARKVLSQGQDDDRAWAVLALCQTLLGNYRFASSAYAHALHASPKNPWYAHNLGHLLDVALDRPDDAVTWLRAAYEGAMGSREIASSYAHALARSGQLVEAKRILTRAMTGGVSREQAAMSRWLEEGAPPAGDTLPRHLFPAMGPLTGEVAVAATSHVGVAVTGDEELTDSHLEATLLLGLDHLPLDERQRARARALARDPAVQALAAGSEARAWSKSRLPSLAAAVAYAIVYADNVPLTQAEVAATYRVSVAALRGRFTALRTRRLVQPRGASM